MRLTDAEFIPSPNYNKVRKGTIFLIVHGTGSSFNSALSWLTNPASKVSAHGLISKTGRLVQLVELENKAWHAGHSKWGSYKDLNTISLGFELENLDNKTDPYSEAQYVTLARVVKECMQIYPEITVDNILGHSQVSTSGKPDPGPMFEWTHFRDLVYTINHKKPWETEMENSWKWARDVGLIKGEPTDTITKYEEATLLARLYNLIKTKHDEGSL